MDIAIERMSKRGTDAEESKQDEGPAESAGPVVEVSEEEEDDEDTDPRDCIERATEVLRAVAWLLTMLLVRILFAANIVVYNVAGLIRAVDYIAPYNGTRSTLARMRNITGYDGSLDCVWRNECATPLPLPWWLLYPIASLLALGEAFLVYCLCAYAYDWWRRTRPRRQKKKQPRSTRHTIKKNA